MNLGKGGGYLVTTWNVVASCSLLVRASIMVGVESAKSDVAHGKTRRENRAGVSLRARSTPAETRSRGCDWLNRLWGIKFRRDPPQTTNATPRLAAGGRRNHKACSKHAPKASNCARDSELQSMMHTFSLSG